MWQVSYRRRLRSLLLCLSDLFQALINSLICWLCTGALGLILFQILSNAQACVKLQKYFCCATQTSVLSSLLSALSSWRKLSIQILMLSSKCSGRSWKVNTDIWSSQSTSFPQLHMQIIIWKSESFFSTLGFILSSFNCIYLINEMCTQQ